MMAAAAMVMVAAAMVVMRTFKMMMTMMTMMVMVMMEMVMRSRNLLDAFYHSPGPSLYQNFDEKEHYSETLARAALSRISIT